MDCWKYCKGYKFALSVARLRAKKLSASGGFAPWSPDQGLCLWTPLGALPQTPAPLEARAPRAQHVPPKKLPMAPLFQYFGAGADPRPHLTSLGPIRQWQSLLVAAMLTKKDLTFKAKDQDKDKDWTQSQGLLFKDQDKDCILVLKESLRTRTNITGLLGIGWMWYW